MTKWLERREKVLHHDSYVSWRSQQVSIGPATLAARHDQRWQPPDLACTLHVKMTQHPIRKSVSLQELTSPMGYHAKHIGPAICRFVVQFRHPTLSSYQLESRISETLIPFNHLPVYHRIKFWNEHIFGQETRDSIHVHPHHVNEGALKDTVTPARFDTALICVRHSELANSESIVPMRSQARQAPIPLQDLRVGQIRVVFTLPDATLDYYFPGVPPEQRPPRHLAYIEWFSKFSASPERNSGFYKVSRSYKDVPVGLIQRSVHLTPKWNGPVPSDWTSENVLDKCSVFYDVLTQLQGWRAPARRIAPPPGETERILSEVSSCAELNGGGWSTNSSRFRTTLEENRQEKGDIFEP
ncbi:hypothetical protein BD309DRAFT_983070 [Dichomitus squalens]|nr:hypothetical protein BD309DRAFT_983070 [Dichomitus squalens]